MIYNLAAIFLYLVPARIPDLKELIPPGVNASQIGLCTKLEGG